MLVSLSPNSPPILEHTADFAAFKVVGAGVGLTAPLCAALAEIGRIGADERHVWIDREWLHAAGPQTAEWAAGLSQMIESAVIHGWTDEAGAVRAHLEFTENL